jgi:hypothetical protein
VRLVFVTCGKRDASVVAGDEAAACCKYSGACSSEVIIVAGSV